MKEMNLQGCYGEVGFINVKYVLIFFVDLEMWVLFIFQFKI